MSTYKTLLVLLGAPTAWVIQMSLSEPIAAYACFPHQVPLSEPLWADLSVILVAISLTCLACGLISGYVAWNSWRKLAKSGLNEQALVVDEGQTQFLAMLGILSSFVFVVAILFTTCAVILVPPCSAWT